MKKTAKLLTLAVAIFAGSVGTAQAEGFKVGADVVSSYVWRGGELGNSPAIQPACSYTFAGSGIVIGGWGSYAISQDAGSRYKEVDLFATAPVGPFSFTVTDYYVPTAGNTRSFDYSSDGPNILELSVGYAKDNLSLLAGINVAGAKGNAVAGTDGVKNAKYFEAGYKVYDKDGYTAKAIVGAGDEDYYGDQYGVAKNSRIALVNTGLSVSHDRYTASYIYNPDTEASHLVIMASF